MTWGYRLCRRTSSDGLGGEETTLAVYEVYFDKRGNPNGISTKPSYPQGGSWEEFLRDASAYQLAWLKPPSKVLSWNEIAKENLGGGS